MNDLAELTRCYTIRFDRSCKHSAALLWRAITEPEEVARWMGCPAKIDLRVGGDYFLEFPSGNGELDGVIVKIERERCLRYVWGVSVIEWILEPSSDGDRCRYQFIHHGQPPRLVDDEEGLPAGWHAWLEDLEAHLEGKAVSTEMGSPRWRELLPPYRERVDAVLGR